MSAQRCENVYEQAVHITHAYLGPAAERFVGRQVRNHLHKESENMTEEDLSLLIHWIRLAVSLLTDDSRIVEEYIGQLEQLAQTPQD
jgi:hypothetical protein